jgi:hypothetical protein
VARPVWSASNQLFLKANSGFLAVCWREVGKKPGLHARGAAFSTFGQSFRYNSAFFQAGRFRRAGIVGGIFQLSLTEYNHE